MKKLLLSLCLSTFLLSNEVVEVTPSPTLQENTFNLDLNYLKSLKKGNDRDFYINEYLKNDISSEEAFKVLSLIDDMKNEIFFNFAKKFKDDETLAVAQCIKMDTKDLIDSYADCIVSGLSLEKMSTLSATDLDLIKQKTSENYPTFVKKLKIISASIPFTKLIVQKKDTFYDIFLNVDEAFRTKYFNYKLPKRTFTKIFKDKNRFNDFLQVSLINTKLNMLHKSLNGLDDTELNFNSSFLLALNAVRLNDLNMATTYLTSATSKTTDIKSLDKIKFWQYQVTKDESILEDLSNSTNLNFYSYLANELLVKKLDDYSFLQRIELFDEQLKVYDKKRVAMLYSIAKIKSNFEANKISENFEVGILQLKSSIIKTISNTVEEKYTFQDQFSVEKNLLFSNSYLNSLEYSFQNPLYLALAYDGKTEILNKKEEKLFLYNKFEPYFSLENMLNGNNDIKKDFLLYYVLYHNSLTKKKKEKITISSIFENLMKSDLKLGE